MLANHLIFILCLFVIALVVRDDFIFVIVYLLAGVIIIGRLWNLHIMRSLARPDAVSRSFTPRAFHGEQIPVQLTVSNRGWLPIPWLSLSESLPVDVAPPSPLHQVISLGPRRSICFDYTLYARKRGLYSIGPLFASTGDLLGLSPEQRWQGSQTQLIVYPRIIRFTGLKLPSHAPLGPLKDTRPLHPDPARVSGKRQYIVGDSLRSIDWKASAATGQLQVKQFDPSISLTTAIALGLNVGEYDAHTWASATELAIIIAASIADWVNRHKQYTALATNGFLSTLSPILPQGRGQPHLMRILELLAQVQVNESMPLVELIQQQVQQLPWGTTLVVIAGQADEGLFDEIFRCRRHGLNAFLVLVGQVQNIRAIKARAAHFKLPLYHIRHELDLDQWR